MEKIVSTTDARRKFSLLLRAVRQGQSYLVTSRGKPVARLIPAGKYDQAALSAHKALLRRLKRQPLTRAKRWTRSELYEGV